MSRFEELGIDERITKAVTELGFTEPTSIQEQAIPVLLKESRDLIGLAQTGTGKTAAFGLPLLHKIDYNRKQVSAVILCPTRELCLQITSDLKKFSKYINGASIVPVYGGASIAVQIQQIRKGAHVIVATPGRMIDILDRGVLDIGQVKWVILDEADEMLNMGFQEDINSILSRTPKDKNVWLFSATMPDQVSKIGRKYMNNPLEVTVGKKNQGAENIEHVYYSVHSKDKYQVLKRLVDFNPGIYAVVFCRTKAETQEVADHLIRDGYTADALHGDLSQAQRDYVMKRYRSKSLHILVATDVAARGIDVSNITHVINYSLPDDVEVYTHRSGRTARAGKSGISIAIIGMREMGRIREIERILNRRFTAGKIPGGQEICERQLFFMVNRIHNAEVNVQAIAQYLPKIYEELNALSKEEVISRLFSMEFERLLEHYRNTPDLGADAGVRRQPDKNAKRLFLNIGQMDGLDNNSMKQFIESTTQVEKGMIKWVDIKNSYSFVEVDERVADMVIAALARESYNNRQVKVEIATPARRENFSGGGNYQRSGGDRGYSRNERRDGGGDRHQKFSRPRSYSKGESSTRYSREERFKGKRPRRHD